MKSLAVGSGNARIIDIIGLLSKPYIYGAPTCMVDSS